MTVKIEDINCDPITMDEAEKTIRQLFMVLLETQNIAIERGDKLIALKEDKLRHYQDELVSSSQWVIAPRPEEPKP